MADADGAMISHVQLDHDRKSVFFIPRRHFAWFHREIRAQTEIGSSVTSVAVGVLIQSLASSNRKIRNSFEYPGFTLDSLASVPTGYVGSLTRLWWRGHPVYSGHDAGLRGCRRADFNYTSKTSDVGYTFSLRL